MTDCGPPDACKARCLSFASADAFHAQVEVTEPEAYMYDGEYERKAAELHQPDLINIRESNVSSSCLSTCLAD